MNFQNTLDKHFAIHIVSEKVFSPFISDWDHSVDQEYSRTGKGKNKLRTYASFKTSLGTEAYVINTLSRSERSALAKFRCGVAPLRVETGRFEGIPEKDRLCPLCQSGIENELHVLTTCEAYSDLQDRLNDCISHVIPNFLNLNNEEKLKIILAGDHYDIVKISAKICSKILYRRRLLLYG